jgi:ribonuclease G
LEKLIVNMTSREKRFAYIKNQQIEKIHFDRPEQRSLVGNIYYGTVTKVLQGMNAVFIDIGEEKNAYLHRDALAKYVISTNKEKESVPVTTFVHQGEKMLVQVDKDVTGTKGPRVTGIIEIPGEHLIYMPKGRYVAVSKKISDEKQKETLRVLGKQLTSEEEGIIFRTSSAAITENELFEELSTLKDQYNELAGKTTALKRPGVVFQKDTFIETVLDTAASMTNGEVVTDDLSVKKLVGNKNPQLKVSYYNEKENIFAAHRVEHEIEKALKRLVWLDNGAYLVFDETEALTIIDVNTGKFSGKIDYQDTVLKTNQLAAKEIVRQLRLRDIGGIVLIDFIDMKREKDKFSIIETIEKELRKDEKRTRMIGFTPLGILQLTRKKTKVSLSEALQVKCPVCEGTGKILSAETVAFRLEREIFEHRHSENEAVLIETTKEVKQLLQPYLESLEELLHFKVFFITRPSSQHHYVVKQFGEVDELAQKAVDFY